jgi:hypothetical protein
MPLGPDHSYRVFTGDRDNLALKSSYKRQGPITSVRIKRVCGSCNSGWMSRSEGKIRQTMSKLMLGSRTFLTKKMRVHLAEYFTYKMMVMDWADGEPTISPDDVQQFYKNNLIPKNTYIYIANCFEGTWRGAHLSAAISLYEKGKIDHSKIYNCKSIAIGFGNLFTLGIFSERVDIELDIHPEQAIRLWPPHLDEIIYWPPLDPISSDQAQALSLVWDEMRRKIEAEST